MRTKTRPPVLVVLLLLLVVLLLRPRLLARVRGMVAPALRRCRLDGSL